MSGRAGPEILTKLYAETKISDTTRVVVFEYGMHFLYWSKEDGTARVLAGTLTSFSLPTFRTLEEAAEFLFIEAARARCYERPRR